MLNMFKILILVTIILLVAYKSIFSQSIAVYVPMNELRNILDSADVTGVVVVHDFNENVYIHNTGGNLKKRQLPASTFKIPNSIIALETGIVDYDSTIFKWDGKERRLDIWNRDMNFHDAFHLSCVPCYQEIARKIGFKRMNEYINKFKYGKMVIDSTNIEKFWLEGESTISVEEQLDFIERFYLSLLPVSDKTEKLMKELMIIEKNDKYTLSGKTGWSVRNNNNSGWFVGYIETKDKLYFFATLIEPKKSFNMDMFPMIRKEIIMKAFKILNIIE